MIVLALLFVLGIIVALALVTFLVTIHEFGHFLSAKFFGVKVEEFGIGFPIPGRAWGKKIGETLYSINWLPAGGFVRLFGEDEDINKPRSFSSKPAWQRAAIIVAGVFINFLFAFILFTILLGFSSWKTDISLSLGGGEIQNKFPFGHQENQVVASFVDKGSPAEKAGLVPGDKILSVNGEKVISEADLKKKINAGNGAPVQLSLESVLNGEKKEVVAQPRFNKDPAVKKGENWQVGIAPSLAAEISYPGLINKIFVGPLHSANMLEYQFVVMKSLFAQSAKEGNAAPISENVSGVVGIVGVILLIIRSLGWGSVVFLLNVLALLSLLLAVVNVLPIPAVDGGRLFFVLFELVTRRKVNQNVERWIHTIGFGVLIVLFLLITFNDLTKFPTILKAFFSS